MRCRLPMTAFALTTSLIFCPGPSFSETAPSSNYKVLASEEVGFNVSSLEKLLEKGDEAVAQENFEEAKQNFKKAREASKLLLSFYRDLSGAFRGLDARIPREMDAKGRKTLILLSKANLRLAALLRRQNQPEVAVPLLVEVVRLTTPAKKEGQKAYQSLVELGFVDTPYLGAR
ncbi:hypothetical protein [Prochlorococcus sp. MIT 1307]|uniref:hypothetical protein n=1 Tax=Prochlorococcus sp. MIT 1307 TaxID=3096219 RepID=UPI002A74DB71|nr:hypothetical protein [Prochlorococcus sp. MIT 1307]